ARGLLRNRGRVGSRLTCAFSLRRGQRPTLLASLDRFEIDLIAHAAVGAGPVVGDLRKSRAGREALARVAPLLVVLVAAGRAAEDAHAPASAPAGLRGVPSAPR